MRSPAYQSALLPCLYRAWGRVGLLAIRPFGTMVTLFLIGASSGGCSFSRGDGGFFSSKAEDAEVVTGSLATGQEPAPTESDLTFARTAASDVLTKGDKDTSQPWANPEMYASEAALFHFDKVKTPTHLVQGDADVRVSYLEGVTLERALQELGVPHEFLVFPGEDHSLTKNPWHGYIKLREELQWLEKYDGR